MAVLLTIANPYPGIRSFETDESYLFHGRKEHSEEVLRLLGEHRFLAVVGSSGSGKSSLVKAGLFPLLYRGYMSAASSRWRIALMRPGLHPLPALADALSSPDALRLRRSPDEIIPRLESSSLGLVELVRSAGLGAGENLLIVVDQFEELFRFRRETQAADGGREAARFVSLLLGSAAQVEIPVYIVLTMRSDFLGDCAQFAGLPEAFNRAQYLVPRLTRQQQEHAIILPLEATDAEITPALVQRLLNDAGNDPDQLPALQHSLMRLYESWKQRGASGPVDLSLYVPELQVGHSLNSHATTLFNSLPPGHQELAQRMFRCLTATEDGRPVRRPKKLGSIYSVVGASSEADRNCLREVIWLYGAHENSLLFSSTGDSLTDETVVDISHETLIREWTLLKGWVKAEAESADWLSRLVRSAELHREDKAGLWGDPDAQIAWNRAIEDGWNVEWASQYRHGYDDAMAFLTQSRARNDLAARKEDERRQREIETVQALAEAHRRKAEVLDQQATAERQGRVRLAWAVAALILALAVVAWFAYSLEHEKQYAVREQTLANQLRVEAQRSEQRARAALNESKARAAEAEALRATGAEKDRLLLDARRYEELARDLELKASKADSSQSPSNAALKRIQDLEMRLAQAQLGIDTVSKENQQLRGAIASRESTIVGLTNELAVAREKSNSNPPQKALDSSAMPPDTNRENRGAGDAASAQNSPSFSSTPTPTRQSPPALATQGQVPSTVQTSSRLIEEQQLRRDLQARQLVPSLSDVVDFAFDPSSGHLAVVHNNGTAEVLDAMSSKAPRTRINAINEIEGIHFDGDGKLIAGVLRGGRLEWFDATTAKPIRSVALMLTGSIAAAGFSPAGKVMFTRIDTLAPTRFELDLWAFPSAYHLYSLSGGSLVYSQDDRWIGALDAGVLKIIELGSHVGTKKINVSKATDASFTSDGKKVAVATGDYKVRVFIVETGAEASTLQFESKIKLIAFNPDGSSIIATSPNGKIYSYDLSSQRAEELSLVVRGKESVQFSHDGRWLTILTTGRALKWYPMKVGDVRKLLSTQETW